MAVGYIYILSNSAHPDLLKVGFTCNPVKDRAIELSSTGVPQPFEVEFYQLSDDVEAVEKLIHADLQAVRPNGNREFFRLPLAQAVQTVEKHVRRPVERFLRETPPSPPSLAVRECGRCGHTFAKTLENRFCPKCGF